MVRSVLDQDLYKLSMGRAVLERYPDVTMGFRFFDRRPGQRWTAYALGRLKEKIQAITQLRLTPEESIWLKEHLPWLGKAYPEFLANFRYNSDGIEIAIKDGALTVEYRGVPWFEYIYWEVPLLASISETYFEVLDTNWTEEGQEEQMEEKARCLNDEGVIWSDFGTRRRRNYNAQDRVVRIAKEFPNFTGTSNVHLAMRNGVRPLGTMAHEWIQAHSVLYSLRHANRYALQVWNEVYRGHLGTGLSDTYGTDAFLNDFDGVLARLFDSVRHDSGDWRSWTHKMWSHYESLGIDPASKPLGYTDNHTVQSATEITRYVRSFNRKCWFGIGTSMSNDYPGSPALSIVIKAVETNGIPVVKLSDSPEKVIGDRDAIRVARWTHFGTPLDQT